MKAQFRTACILAAPALAVVGFTLGMRHGASTPEVYVEVSRTRSAGPGAEVALQFTTMLRKSGIDERLPNTPLHVTLTTPRGRHEHDVVSNADAVAIVSSPYLRAGEVWGLHVEPRVAQGSALDGSVRPDDEVPFEVRFGRETPAKVDKRSGAIDVALFPVGGGLPVSFEGDLVARARFGSAVLPPLTWSLAPEPGLSAAATPALVCPAAGLAVFRMRPDFAVTGLTVKAAAAAPARAASEPSPPVEVVGEWFGALPTAPGLASVDLSILRAIAAEAAFDVSVAVPSPKHAFYVEILSARGQWLLRDLGEVTTQATVRVPALPAGDYVAVLANHFSARDRSNAYVAPFAVGEVDPCARAARALAAPSLVLASPSVVVSGADLVDSHARARRTRGYAVGFASLACGLAALALLVHDALRESRRKLAALAADAEMESVALVATGSSGALVGIALALLAFGILAVVSLAKSN